MEDVSDPPFRAVCHNLGADLTYTEFISSEGLIKGTAGSRRKLDFYATERPVGIQLYGGDEDSLARAAAIVDAAHPDPVSYTHLDVYKRQRLSRSPSPTTDL